MNAELFADLMESVRDIARARGMSALAREMGLGRDTLYKALSGEGLEQFS
ncbi:MAG: hypothetical protein LBR88_09205 [Zoogloeaceae bacterium]|jgi:probable addiction module antidote protein|nr:hypothetical protein [Zoogloeaceae bacterium]